MFSAIPTTQTQSPTTKNDLDIGHLRSEVTHLVYDCLGDVDCPICSGLRLHAALPTSLGFLLWLGSFLGEHRGEVEHIGGAVERGLEKSSVEVGMVLKEILEGIIEHGLSTECVRAPEERFENVKRILRMGKARGEM